MSNPNKRTCLTGLDDHTKYILFIHDNATIYTMAMNGIIELLSQVIILKEQYLLGHSTLTIRMLLVVVFFRSSLYYYSSRMIPNLRAHL